MNQRSVMKNSRKKKGSFMAKNFKNEKNEEVKVEESKKGGTIGSIFKGMFSKSKKSSNKREKEVIS
jgi:hypothetical protein